MNSVASLPQHDRLIRLAGVHEFLPSAALRTNEMDTEVVDIRLDVIKRYPGVATYALPHGRPLKFEGILT